MIDLLGLHLFEVNTHQKVAIRPSVQIHGDLNARNAF